MALIVRISSRTTSPATTKRTQNPTPTARTVVAGNASPAGVGTRSPYDAPDMGTNDTTAGYSIAIETSGRLGSVAIAQGPDVLGEVEFTADQRHAVELLPTIDGLCRAHDLTPSDITHLFVSGGPGSFTGVRIGMTVARTLAALGTVRVVVTPTLSVIAQNALDANPRPLNLAVLLDAKRSRVFAAMFVLRDDRYDATTKPDEVDPAEFLSRLPRPAVLLGEGVAFVGDSVARTDLVVLPDSFHRPRARVVHQLGYAQATAGHVNDPGELLPTYVRRPEAEEVWEKRQRQTNGTQ